MPIFPRYEPQRISVPTPETPAEPADLGPARRLQAAGQALMAGGDVIQRVALKRQALEDESLVLERYMQAASQLDEVELSLVGENAMSAREVYDKAIQAAEPRWFKGLRPEAAVELQKKLFTRVAEGRMRAARIENRARADRFGTALLDGERRFVERSARGLLGGDIAQSDDYRLFAEALEKGVQLGYLTAEEAEKQRTRVLQDGAYALARRMVVDTPEEFLALQDREDTESGTNLRHLPPEKRNELRAAAIARRDTLRREREHQEDRARAERDRITRELAEKTEALIEKKLRGDPDAGSPLTVEFLDQMNDLRLLSGEKYRFYREAMTTLAVEGGPGDPETIRSLGLRVASAENTPETRHAIASLQSEVMEAARKRKVPLKTAMEWLQSIRLKEKREGDIPPTLSQQHTMAKQLITETLRVTGPMAQSISIPAQQVLTMALEELDRNAAAGYPVPPLQLYYAKRSQWMAQLGQPALVRVMLMRRELKTRGYTNVDDPDARLRDLLARESTFRTRDEFLAEVRRLRDLEDFERQVQVFIDAGRAAGGAGGSAGRALEGQAGTTAERQAPTSPAPGGGYIPPVPALRR